jgi:hypothetical protein
MEEVVMKANAFTPYLQGYTLEILSALVVVFFLVIMFWGASILATGIFLGLITTFSFGLIVWQFYTCAPRVYNWMKEHPLITNLCCTVFLGAMFGLSVTGLIAAGSFGVFHTIALLLANKHLPDAKTEPLVWLNKFKAKFTTDSKELSVVESELAGVA